MKLDISKVNLLEKDIEDWLYENPDVIYGTHGKGPVEKWIGRQYQLPSGIADLIGIREDGKLVVVEIKNVAINKAAVLQVCRYADDLKHIVSNRICYPHDDMFFGPQIEMVLVGPSIDGQTFTEAQAVGVRVFQFSAELTLNISTLNWNKEFRDDVREQQQSIASRPEWDIYGLTIAEDIEKHRREQECESQTNEDDGEDYSDIILTNHTEE